MHSITECPSEVVTGPSMSEEIEDLLSNPMFEMPGESSMCNSPRRPPLMVPLNPTANKEENPPNPGEALQGYLKQLPPSPYGSSQVDMANNHSPLQLLPLAEYPGEGHQPYSSPIAGQLCQPVGQCIAPSRGNE